MVQKWLHNGDYIKDGSGSGSGRNGSDLVCVVGAVRGVVVVVLVVLLVVFGLMLTFEIFFLP